MNRWPVLGIFVGSTFVLFAGATCCRTLRQMPVVWERMARVKVA